MSRILLLCLVLSACAPAAPVGAEPGRGAVNSSSPVTDPHFLRLSTGQDLRRVVVSGSPLVLTTGSGVPFREQEKQAYLALLQATKTQPNHGVQWALMDLDSGRLLDSSANPSRKQFGASVSKIFVGAALVDKQNGAFSQEQLQLMAEMLVVSSNTAWTKLQNQAGDGDSDRGRETIHRFTQRMGYARTRGFQGYWGSIHGNELTADELVAFLHDTYQGRYPGAEVVWKLMHTHRTGASRGKKYLPRNVFVGGKTGTYSGPTVDPETGSPSHPDGSPYTVSVHHHTLAFHVNGRELGLAVLADSGSDESAALLMGGLYREYAGEL